MKTSNHKYSLLLIAVICLFSAGCKTDRKKNNVSFEKTVAASTKSLRKVEMYIYNEGMMGIYMCLMGCSFMIYSQENIKGYIILT